MKKYDVVTIGDASEDIFVRPQNIKVLNDSRFVSGKAASFELGEKIMLEDVSYETGGSACNNAVAFSRQGLNTAAILAIGEDTPAEKIYQKLEEEGVTTNLIIKKKRSKSNFSVIFNIGDERTIFVYHGLEDYKCLKPAKKINTKYIFLAPVGDGDEEVIDGVVSQAAENNTKVLWNPGAKQIEKGAAHFRKLLQLTQILFVNREEAIKFIKLPVRPQLKELLSLLHQYGPKVVVVTDGKRGASAYDGRIFLHADALTQERVDATGAGDSFASGFSGYLMNTEIEQKLPDYKEALKWGIINSTSVVSYIGAQRGLLSSTEIQSQLEKKNIIVTEL